MKFHVVVNRWANFYFFVQNLSEWHFSNRTNYNYLWRKELGPFSSEEELALSRFREIHKNYSFGKMYLGRQFFLEDDPWITLEEKLEAEELENIKKTFSLFEKKFEKIYEKDLSSFEYWQIELQEKLNREDIINSIVTILGSLYNTGQISKTITIYLLFSAGNLTGGTGGVVNDQSLLIEVSQTPLSRINYVIGTIWHECIHASFENQYFMPLLKKKYLDDLDMISLIKEVVASALFPNGILGQKIFNNKEKLLHIKIPRQYNALILSLVNEYIKRKEKFDDRFIELLQTYVFKLKGIVK
ncbi:MAG: hypothetical protein NUV83_00105 [Candidatus Wolfebacteria bacterium]|nr:hypothetical protein [Candidatus Wolfebacteria bacterium]